MEAVMDEDLASDIIAVIGPDETTSAGARPEPDRTAHDRPRDHASGKDRDGPRVHELRCDDG